MYNSLLGLYWFRLINVNAMLLIELDDRNRED